MALQPICLSHPDAPAPYVCTRCGRWHCAACARPIDVGRQGVKGCAHCSGILMLGEVAAPPDGVQDLLGRMLTTEGAMTVVALSLPGFLSLAGLGPGSLIFGVLYAGAVAGFFFQTIHHVARGKRGLPFLSEVTTMVDATLMVLRGCLAGFAAAIPSALAWYFGATTLGYALIPVGVLIAPASVLAGVVTNSSLNQLWPPAWYQVIAYAPRSYAALCAWLYTTGVAGALLVWLVLSTLGALPFVGAGIAAVMCTVLVVFHAGLFGRHLQIEGARSYGLTL